MPGECLRHADLVLGCSLQQNAMTVVAASCTSSCTCVSFASGVKAVARYCHVQDLADVCSVADIAMRLEMFFCNASEHSLKSNTEIFTITYDTILWTGITKTAQKF